MELATLLHQAEAASASVRIERRDAIAAFGPRAIEAVSPWLGAEVAAFAVRVNEQVGVGGEPLLASKALEYARAVVPAHVSGDIAWALEHIKAQGRALPVPKARATPTRARSMASSRPGGHAR